MRKGISLIVLVITIIVMIILAASVVITLSNTGVINKASQAVDLTNERQVQDLAALVWADAYMDKLRGQDLVDEVTTKLIEQGITQDDWNISVTNAGVTITNKNNGQKTGKLGDLIKDATDYGKIVDYSAGGIDEWQVFYEDKTNGYVFLISKEFKEYTTLSSMNSSDLTENQKQVFTRFKLGNAGYTLTDAHNSNVVASMIIAGETYTNTAEYGDNVVGALIGPTLELFAAGYNEKYGRSAITSVVDVTYNDEDEDGDGTYEYYGSSGYFINNKGQTNVSNLEQDEIYVISGKEYWILAPSAADNYAYSSNDVYYVLANNRGASGIYTSCWCEEWYTPEKSGGGSVGYRPVVCLKADIQAKEVNGGYSLIK